MVVESESKGQYPVGELEGAKVEVGTAEGLLLGVPEGSWLSEGLSDGISLGASDGAMLVLGTTEGNSEGTADGLALLLGDTEGTKLFEGCTEAQLSRLTLHAKSYVTE